MKASTSKTSARRAAIKFVLMALMACANPYISGNGRFSADLVWMLIFFLPLIISAKFLITSLLFSWWRDAERSIYPKLDSMLTFALFLELLMLWIIWGIYLKEWPYTPS